MVHIVNVVTSTQDRNEVHVYGIRDQRPEKGRDQGSQPLGSGITTCGIGISSIFHGIRDQIFAGSGIKILVIFGIRDHTYIFINPLCEQGSI